MSDHIYETLGVETIVNAAGPVTRLSGALMDPEVTAAMAEAAGHCVDIAELQAAAGRYIAEVTGAEAGYVTSGASAGLLLGVAACVTGLDPGAMNRLPDTAGLPSEVIMPRSHRNFYDHAIRSVGVKLIEVGIPDRFSGAGVRDTEAWEIGDAITERTAAIAYVANARSRPPLEEVVKVAHDRDVPVIVDAAGQLPPASNLKRFIAQGADLVCFSGGKVVGGPQGSGIACGRRDLIAAMALQHLDLDVHYELWDPPAEWIDKKDVPGAPHHGIGRPCKVGKEAIVGLLTALRRFVAVSDEDRSRGWIADIKALEEGVAGIDGVGAIASDGGERGIPSLTLAFDRLDGIDAARRFMTGACRVFVGTSGAREGVVSVNPVCLRDGDVEKMLEKIRSVAGDA
ncbi:MAG: L-seryl-tRNA selenium transferase [Gemmatimonadetes bacterium]|nr:L-seryl-tRNA selenium transferase [Gemmatimonadota bacterium]|tara:strand:- start:295 stop:1491 length:1197 start_codon:yes stop_codon:yes gene_type:complete